MRFLTYGAISVALLALTGIGASSMAPAAQNEPHPDPPPIEVPESRVGDTFVYEIYRVDPGTGAETLRASKAMHIVAHDASPDWRGQTRDVVTTTTTWTHHGADGHARSSDSLSQRHQIDAQERIGVRLDTSYTNEGETIDFSLLRPFEPQVPFVAVQGQTLVSNETVVVGPRVETGGWNAGWGASGGSGLTSVLVPRPAVHDMEFRVGIEPDDVTLGPPRLGLVGPMGVLEGTRVVAVTTTDERAVGAGHGDHHGHGHGDPSGVVLIRDHTTAWFSETSPYPMLIDTTVVLLDDEGHVVETSAAKRWLASYTPGDGAPAWQGHERRDSGDPERTEGSHVPADGSDSTLGYPLADARADAFQTPPVEWLAWQQSHPDMRLVSARMTPGTHDRDGLPSLEWRLVFAEPSGAAYLLRAERVAQGVTVVEGLGETQVTPYGTHDLPTAPLTLAQVETYWRAFGADGPVTYVHWGLRDIADVESRTCRPDAMAPPAFTDEDVANLHRIQLGTTTLGPCFDDRGTTTMTGIEVDAESGMILATFDMVQPWDRFEHGAPASDGPANVTPLSTGSAPVPAPDLALASFATSSLLLIIITFYLVPHAKWFLGQAFVALPGFSKLKKDQILDHKLRETLYGHIQANPGVHPSELQRRSGAGWGTVVYHLSVLERHGLVRSTMDGRHRRYLPAAATDAPDATRHAVLANEKTHAAMAAIAAEPGVPTSKIAARLDVTTAGAMWHLARLVDAGLVERRKEGRTARFFPCGEGNGQGTSCSDKAAEQAA